METEGTEYCTICCGVCDLLLQISYFCYFCVTLGAQTKVPSAAVDEVSISLSIQAVKNLREISRV